MFNFLKALFNTGKPARVVESSVDLNIYFKYRFSKFYGLSGVDYYYGIVDFLDMDTIHSSGFMASNPQKKISLGFVDYGTGNRKLISISKEEFERKAGDL